MTSDHTATPATGNLADSASPTAPKGGPMTAAAAAAEPEPVLLSPDAIDPDHWPNPRGAIDKTSAKYRELQGSIAAQGILQPVVVGPPMLKGGRRPLIAGWRRYTAASEAQLEHIPVRERPDITTEHQALQAALAENMAREDMTPLAEANSIKRLMDLGDTQAEAARIVGVSERTARERLRLLTLPAAVRNAIDAGTIPTTASRQLQVIADVSPKGASALAKRITAGKLRPGALLDPQLTRQALFDVRKDSGLVALQGSIQIGQLPLPPAALRALKARARKAAEHTYNADWVDLSPTAVGKKLMQEATDAGKILTITGDAGDSTIYLADPEWIQRAVSTALDRAEKRATDRKAQLARDRAKQDTCAEQDPAERARLQREREQADRDALAQPFAAAMNAELGERLRAMRSCPLEGAVARLLLHLTLEHHYYGQLARNGYALVDPEHRYVTCADDKLHTIVDTDVENAETPEAAAAILVAAHIALLYADPRAGRGASRRDHYIHDATKPLIRAAAQTLGVLPDRAERLDEARRTYANALAYHRGEGDRRRILHELTKAARKGLQRDALYERCKVHSNDAHGHGASVQIWQHHQLDSALEQLKVAAHITVDETEGTEGVIQRHYRVTAAGRKALTAPVPDAPLFPAIDPLPDPAAQDDPTVVIVHVTPSGTSGDPVEAELQPERQAGRPNVRKVIYTESRTAAWVAVKRIVDLPSDPPGDDEPADATPAPKGTRREQALAHIAKQPGITIPELAERMQIQQNYLYRLLPGLADDGEIRKDGRGWFPPAANAAAAA